MVADRNTQIDEYQNPNNIWILLIIQFIEERV
jgi:hypothetical protein